MIQSLIEQGPLARAFFIDHGYGVTFWIRDLDPARAGKERDRG